MVHKKVHVPLAPPPMMSSLRMSGEETATKSGGGGAQGGECGPTREHARSGIAFQK